MMNNDTAPKDSARDSATTEGPDGQPDAVPTPSQAADQEPDPIVLLEAEKADLKDRLMRALAETENLRRRGERDTADARTYAVTGFARDMLTVADNIRRALESAPADGADGAAKALIEGIELTERDLLKTLERHGVKRLEPKGVKFDPNLHQAMFEVPDNDVPNGTVVQVVQTGYVIGDRVLRPALVGVAKGGSKERTANSASNASGAAQAERS